MANYDGRPGNFPITAYYKGTFNLRFAFTSGGSAYNIAGSTASFAISEKNGTAALTLTSGAGLTINGAAGTIDLEITNAQIVALATMSYNYEFLVTLASGDVWPVLDGTFTVSEAGQANYSGDTVTVALDGSAVTLSVVPGPPTAKIGGVQITPTTGSTATAGNSKAAIRIPAELNGTNLVAVGASCTTAASSGTTTVQLRRVRGGASADMLSTPLTIDSGETDSSTAATAAVIDVGSDDLQTGDQIHFDLDNAGSGMLGLYISFTIQ